MLKRARNRLTQPGCSAARRRRALLTLALLFAIASLAPIARAADVRGSVSSVETTGEVRIDLPAGSVVRTGDSVRIEAVVPDIGPVEIKARWRVKLVGEGFIIAEPEGRDRSTPQVGHTAIVTSAVLSPSEEVAESKQVGAEPTSAPSAPLTASQLAELAKLADGGDPRAMVMLGWYHRGQSMPSDAVPRSLDVAVGWLEKAAAPGDAGAMVALGVLHQSRRKDFAKAAKWFHKAAQKGDSAAMLALSGLYANGLGVPKDEAQAFGWAEKAAQVGNEMVAFTLAEMHYHGRGTRQDYVEAAHWYRKAADKGLPLAMNMLGRQFRDGRGVAKDSARSFEWFLKGAEAGSRLAMTNLGVEYSNGRGVTENQAEARRWMETAANAGDATAKFNLAWIHQHGIGGPTNPKLGADWMVQAIAAGSPHAIDLALRKPWGLTKPMRQEFQKRLHSVGIYQGRTDGTFDASTRKAIAALAARDLAGRK